jgi:hypothetical protein
MKNQCHQVLMLFYGFQRSLIVASLSAMEREEKKTNK